MALVGALRRCAPLAVLALQRAGRRAIAAWLYSAPGLRCNPSGQNHIHFHNLFQVGTQNCRRTDFERRFRWPILWTCQRLRFALNGRDYKTDFYSEEIP